MANHQTAHRFAKAVTIRSKEGNISRRLDPEEVLDLEGIDLDGVLELEEVFDLEGGAVVVMSKKGKNGT